MPSPRREPALALLLLFAAACAKGGSEDRPPSDVTVARTHHFVRLTGAPDFARFPVADTEVSPLVGLFDTTDEARYGITIPGTQRVEDSYTLADDGTLALQVAQAQAPTLVYRGGYGLEGSTANYFFTDRVSTRIGLYFGVPIVAGAPVIANFAGVWHLLTLQVLFANSSTLPSVHAVGRSLAGTVTVAVDGTFTGQGSESRSPTAQLPTSGTLRGFTGGEFEIDLRLGTDDRKFEGGGTASLIAGVETDVAVDRAAGLCAFLRARTTRPTFGALAGTYAIGAYELQAAPAASGTDALVGTLEITSGAQFRMEVRTNAGVDVEYTGSMTAADDGALTFRVSRPAETWRGAVDAGNDTIVLVDNEVTADTLLRMFVAIRRKTT